jgi:outer membrane protein OmpA-like peptidoglycan-associated protein
MTDASMPIAEDYESGQSPAVELHRIAGEDSPVWIAGGLALLGVAMAVTAALLAREAPPEAVRLAPVVIEAPSSDEMARARRRLEEALRTASTEVPAQARVAEAPPASPDCAPLVAATFPHDSAKTDFAELDARIAPLLAWLRDHPDATALVEGHTDPTGAEKHNVVLSFERAQSVGAWLVDKGVDKSRVTIRAAGSLLPNAPAPVLADNRQALIAIEGAPRCLSDPGGGK